MGDLRLIPVLVMSRSALPDDINRVYALGANSYIVKPANWRVFKKLVADLRIYWIEYAATPEVPAAALPINERRVDGDDWEKESRLPDSASAILFRSR